MSATADVVSSYISAVNLLLPGWEIEDGGEAGWTCRGFLLGVCLTLDSGELVGGSLYLHAQTMREDVSQSTSTLYP